MDHQGAAAKIFNVLQVVLLLKLRSLQRRSALLQRVPQVRPVEQLSARQRPMKEMKLMETRPMMMRKKKKRGKRRK